MSLRAVLRTRVLGISPGEAAFTRRGFHARDEAARQRLEHVGRTFIVGYRHGLEEDRPAPLERRLRESSDESRGFAYEGAAMALGLRDLLGRRRSRIAALLAGPGDRHAYMVAVGVGWALARASGRLASTLTRRRAASLMETLGPFHRWLAVDGYGFHQGYFHSRHALIGGVRPRELTGYAARAFDHGLGRSAWFVAGGDPERVASTFTALDPDRHPDLWSGVGLAVAYAGGADVTVLDELNRLAGGHRAHVAQGAAFAAKARERASNPALHTDLACRVLCGVTSSEAAEWTDRSLAGLEGARADEPTAYETWRARIRSQYLTKGAA